ncbi:MAG: nucleotidyltransferase domain-containing protein [Candidatus Bathyarchaeia archaeon]|jgi:predicted nucleotidyltransferase|nr:DNA polymerase subunit beta [Candidatus Bathyarchaeota archaeon A05DMB-4]MDH7594921.1 nucleotidyltransferase domain-containing protein [Candidatus Bathyarchaeota archaeon]
MAKKPLRHAEQIEVIYDNKRWRLLKMLRCQALNIMEALARARVYSVVHGSIARGDVSEKSDVDVFLPEPPSSFIIECALENAGFSINRRVLVQATPVYAAKGYIELNEKQCVSFPLVKMRRVERDFYRYSGEINLEMLRNNLRVAGVDKRLMLIKPTEKGHVESSIVGREEEVAKILGVSLETVLDRVHALLRRDDVGRTGVFVEKELASDETFEMVLQLLAKKNPAVRRRLSIKA